MATPGDYRDEARWKKERGESDDVMALDLDAIKERYAQIGANAYSLYRYNEAAHRSSDDVPTLVAEVERQAAILDRLHGLVDKYPWVEGISGAVIGVQTIKRALEDSGSAPQDHQITGGL